jgi:hypothetical protein
VVEMLVEMLAGAGGVAGNGWMDDGAGKNG